MRHCKKLKHLDNTYKELNLQHIIIQNADEFCRNTTLHGLKYVADSKLKTGERCFFAFALISVVCLATYLIVRVYDRWSSTPVIVGINPKPTFIIDEPFPAVSICNFNQALASKAQHFSKNSSEYAMLQLLCKRDIHTSGLQTITNWSHLESFIVNISQPCEDMLIECRFGGKVYKCSEIFRPLVTDEGLCCVFNMLHSKFMYVSHVPLTFQNHQHDSSEEPVDWNSEMGYPNKLPNAYYPKKVVGVGESLGLTVALDVQKDKYYCSSSSSVGFKFALHSPNESPNIRETGFSVEHGKETKLRISPDKIETKKHLKTVKRKYRQCLFHHEGNLKFFAHYTQRNCELECVAEIAKNYCGCVSYFMPKIFENISVCSIDDAHCQRKVLFRTDKRMKSCLDDCLPSCYSLNFEVNAFSTKLSHVAANGIKSNLNNLSHSYVEENMAIVHMYFKEHSYRSKIQTEFIGDFFISASIGGLLGLFLGFSFISIAEVIYFAVIRPYQDISKSNNSGDDCKNMANRSHDNSSIKVKTLKCFVSKHCNNELATAEIYNQQRPQKMVYPYLLHNDLKKPGVDVSYVWLE